MKQVLTQGKSDPIFFGSVRSTVGPHKLFRAQVIGIRGWKLHLFPLFHLINLFQSYFIRIHFALVFIPQPSSSMPASMTSNFTGHRKIIFFCRRCGCWGATLFTTLTETILPSSPPLVNPVYDAFPHFLWTPVFEFFRGTWEDPKPAPDTLTISVGQRVEKVRSRTCDRQVHDRK